MLDDVLADFYALLLLLVIKSVFYKKNLRGKFAHLWKKS